MTDADLEAQAIELLAREYERDDRPNMAFRLRNCSGYALAPGEPYAIRAILAALKGPAVEWQPISNIPMTLMGGCDVLLWAGVPGRACVAAWRADPQMTGGGAWVVDPSPHRDPKWIVADPITHYAEIKGI